MEVTVHDSTAPAPSSPTTARKSDRVAGGVCLTLAGIGILMGSITAEALFSGVYSTHADTLSHLGASEPPNSVVTQPSAAIFNITMLLTGGLILAGAWFTHRAFRHKAVTIPTALLGVGVLGVGVFPLTDPGPHTLFALIAFYSGGVAVILSARRATRPFRYLWMPLGAVSLIAISAGIFLADWAPVANLGEGGIERWNAYPIVLWLVAYGSYLLADTETARREPG